VCLANDVALIIPHYEELRNSYLYLCRLLSVPTLHYVCYFELDMFVV